MYALFFQGMCLFCDRVDDTGCLTFQMFWMCLWNDTILSLQKTFAVLQSVCADPSQLSWLFPVW